MCERAFISLIDLVYCYLDTVSENSWFYWTPFKFTDKGHGPLRSVEIFLNLV